MTRRERPSNNQKDAYTYIIVRVLSYSYIVHTGGYSFLFKIFNFISVPSVLMLPVVILAVAKVETP